MIYYPAFLNLKGKRVLLFGGGRVALRKARALRAAGAELIAISRDFSKAFLQFAKRRHVQLRRGQTIPRSLHSAQLVIAATSHHALNRQVYERCRKDRVLVNVVDDPEHSTFIVPSVLRRGAFQIAITTGGASPLLAKLLRQKLGRQFGAEYGSLVWGLKQDRERVKQSILTAKQRRSHFRKTVASRLKVLG